MRREGVKGCGVIEGWGKWDNPPHPDFLKRYYYSDFLAVIRAL
jgi:hypothetical protein